MISLSNITPCRWSSFKGATGAPAFALDSKKLTKVRCPSDDVAVKPHLSLNESTSSLGHTLSCATTAHTANNSNSRVICMNLRDLKDGKAFRRVKKSRISSQLSS